ncbi:unnamed protein product [Soboliphyme baturini]|uniref:Tr-type G domain-containing protein n=1 Tax=Soboliphyme baturini TaxID=241478 RepID=A0A183IWG2_9BILA|nr:unnamed protein product [Soboliphyme baturini]
MPKLSCSSHVKSSATGNCLSLLLPPEDDEGNVEYKLKLINPSPSRFQHLVTQLKWRLREGQGEAIYEIGVEDNGTCTGLTATDLAMSLSTLKRMASEEREITDKKITRKVVELLIRKVPECQQFIDLRIAVLGCADSGKSTLLGVLTEGEMDNGRGKSRLNLFRHLHEIQTGRTSSVGLGIVGFDADGQILNHRFYSDDEICDLSHKLITFIDLAGHQKYMKTTIFGLSGYNPHFLMLVVDALVGLGSTTRDHLAWSFALDLPVFVVVSKIDVTSNAVVLRTINSLESVLKAAPYNKLPFLIRSKDDAIAVASSLQNQRVVPIFTISSVTGEHFDYLERFLNLLSPYSSREDLRLHMQEDCEFHIDEIYNVSDVGTVLCGLLSKGIIREGDRLMLGPSQSGEFQPVIAESLHRVRTPCRHIQAGQYASIAIGDVSGCNLRKGMVLLSPSVCPVASQMFTAEVYVLFHTSKYIGEKFQATVHVCNVCQTVIVTRIHTKNRLLKVGERAVISCMFLRQPEYITTGSRLLFHEGRTKGIGEVIETYP